MFFISPGLVKTSCYVGAAVIPAVVLLRYIYKKDKVEREPAGLLLACLLQGVFAALASIVLESIGEGVLPNFMDPNTKEYTIVLAFVIVAAVEEGTKMFFLKRKTWKNRNFNYKFDGIVYAVFVSLGFAAFENIGYVYNYGLSVAPMRAFLSIPGHMGFSVIMGYFYARAKHFETRGQQVRVKRNLFAGFCGAVLMHGFYDACAMIGTDLAMELFFAFVVAMYIGVFILIRREAKGDEPIWKA